MLAKQVLYRFNQSQPFFVLGIFEIESNYLPGLPSNHDPPHLCLPRARITGMSHWRLAGATSSEFCRPEVH
jgi:hypothetical protein